MKIHGSTARAMKREHDRLVRAEQERRAIKRLMEEMGMTELQAIGALEQWKRNRGSKTTLEAKV